MRTLKIRFKTITLRKTSKHIGLKLLIRVETPRLHVKTYECKTYDPSEYTPVFGEFSFAFDLLDRTLRVLERALDNGQVTIADLVKAEKEEGFPPDGTEVRIQMREI